MTAQAELYTKEDLRVIYEFIQSCKVGTPTFKDCLEEFCEWYQIREKDVDTIIDLLEGKLCVKH